MFNPYHAPLTCTLYHKPFITCLTLFHTPTWNSLSQHFCLRYLTPHVTIHFTPLIKLNQKIYTSCWFFLQKVSFCTLAVSTWCGGISLQLCDGVNFLLKYLTLLVTICFTHLYQIWIRKYTSFVDFLHNKFLFVHEVRDVVNPLLQLCEGWTYLTSLVKCLRTIYQIDVKNSITTLSCSKIC